MGEDEKEYAMIPVFRGTKERLDIVANKAHTYDEFINLLLDLYEKKAGK